MKTENQEKKLKELYKEVRELKTKLAERETQMLTLAEIADKNIKLRRKLERQIKSKALRFILKLFRRP